MHGDIFFLNIIKKWSSVFLVRGNIILTTTLVEHAVSFASHCISVLMLAHCIKEFLHAEWIIWCAIIEMSGSLPKLLEAIGVMLMIMSRFWKMMQPLSRVLVESVQPFFLACINTSSTKPARLCFIILRCSSLEKKPTHFDHVLRMRKPQSHAEWRISATIANIRISASIQQSFQIWWGGCIKFERAELDGRSFGIGGDRSFGKRCCFIFW